VGGIITPPLLVAAAANNVRTQQFLISSSLIVSGICTVIHCIQLKIPFTGGRLFYGTGAVTFPGAGHECG
jgi:xanthine/uracil permease